MKKITYFVLCLIGFSLGFSSCNKEETEIIEEPTPDPYDIIEFYSIEYDFSKKEIRNYSSPEFKESFENNSDQIVPVTVYPYLDQGLLEFNLGKLENILVGLECEVPVPCYENETWSESEMIIVKTSFGETPTFFNPFNGNISFTIETKPWETLRYSYVLNYSELTVPFEAIFIGNNYGVEYNFSGLLNIRVPINCDLTVKE